MRIPIVFNLDKSFFFSKSKGMASLEAKQVSCKSLSLNFLFRNQVM